MGHCLTSTPDARKNPIILQDTRTGASVIIGFHNKEKSEHPIRILRLVRVTGLEPVRLNTRPSNVPVCQFQHTRKCRYYSTKLQVSCQAFFGLLFQTINCNIKCEKWSNHLSHLLLTFITFMNKHIDHYAIRRYRPDASSAFRNSGASNRAMRMEGTAALNEASVSAPQAGRVAFH